MWATMAGESLGLVERGYEAFERRDFPVLVELLTEDFELDLSGYPIPDFPARGIGAEIFMSFLATYLSGLEDYTIQITRIVEAGDEIVVLFHDSARMPDSEAIVERDPAHVWTLRGGKLHRLRAFTSHGEALEAVGLRE